MSSSLTKSVRETCHKYVVDVRYLAKPNPYYDWLVDYLEPEKIVLSPATTRVLIVDYYDSVSSPTLKTIPIASGQDYDDVLLLLTARSHHVRLRLVAVWCMSGIGDRGRQKVGFFVTINIYSDLILLQQLFKRHREASVAHNTVNIQHLPIVTQPPLKSRPPKSFTLANRIPSYQTETMDPIVLCLLGHHLDVHPGVFMEHLRDYGHLSEFYGSWPSGSFMRSDNRKWQMIPRDALRLGANEMNHMTFVSSSSIPKTGMNFPVGSVKHLTKGEILCILTALMLVTEDDCLGIDFSPDALPVHQPLLRHWQCTTPYNCGTIYDGFCDLLQDSNPETQHAILSDPRPLAWIYGELLLRLFSCHVDLCRIQWYTKYQPVSKTSLTFGYAIDRYIVAVILHNHRTSLQYLKLSLKVITAVNHVDPHSDLGGLNSLQREFEGLMSNIESLIAVLEPFLDRQLEKTALRESQESRKEGQQLKTLSYLGFFFVPISLACSIFGMNIQEFNGDGVPLRTFIQAAVIIVGITLFILLLSWIPRLHELYGPRIKEKITPTWKRIFPVEKETLERPPTVLYQLPNEPRRPRVRYQLPAQEITHGNLVTKFPPGRLYPHAMSQQAWKATHVSGAVPGKEFDVIHEENV